MPASAQQVTQAALRSTLLVAGRGMAVRVVGFATTLVLARQLAPKDFGVLAIGIAFMSVATLLANGGLGASLIQQSEKPDREDLRALQGFQLVVTGLILLAAAAAAPLFGTVGVVTAVTLAALPLVSLQAAGSIMLERELLFGPRVVVELAETVTYAAVAVAAAAAGLGVIGVAAAFPVRALAGLLVMRRVSPVGLVPPSMHLKRARRMLGFGAKFQAVGIVGLVRDQGTNFGIAAIGGLPLLGLWSLAYRIIQVPALMFEALWRVSFPAMARLLGTDADPALVLNRCLRMGATCTALLLVGVAGSSPSLIPVLFGPDWAGATDVLPWAWASLMVGGPVSIALSGFLYARGDARTALNAGIAQAALTLLVGLPLVRVMGLSGIGVALAVATLADVVVLVRGARAHARIDLRHTIVWPTVLALIAGTGGWFVAAAMDPTLLSVVSSGLFAEATLVVGFLVFDRSRLSELWRVGQRALERPSELHA